MGRQKPQPPAVVRRDGGLCATFANTAARKRKGFAGYPELLAWALRCGAVTAAEGERLERAAAERPRDANAVFIRALQVRSWLRRILQALARRESPDPADLASLNDAVGAVLSARRLVAAPGGGWRWAWGDRGGDDLDRMLWPVVASAADLLASPHFRKVRLCAGEGCDLLFVDRTPGSPRRWCSMRACGARVKARRHYHRAIKPAREERERRYQELRARESRERRARRASEGVAEGSPGEEGVGQFDS